VNPIVPPKFIYSNSLWALMVIEGNAKLGYERRNEQEERQLYPHFTYYLCEGDNPYGMLIEVKETPEEDG